MQKQEKLEEQRDRIIREANEKANAILREAKEVADETIRNFHKFGKENISAAEMEKERERLRKKIKDTSASASLKTNKPKKTYKPSDFKLRRICKSIKYESDRHHRLSPRCKRQRHSSDGNPSVTSQYFRFGNYRRSIALRTESG